MSGDWNPNSAAAPQPWNNNASGQRSYGLDAGYGGNTLTPSAVRPSSALVRLDSSVGNLGDVVRNIEQLADDLCGPVPQAVSGEAAAKHSGGVFGMVAFGADAIDSATMRISNAIFRIRNQLP